ncbi:hypothetical protein BJ165DRAFT_1408591 [Panaeolus papilionaceus]|nr:hypothetical protein BJ165DRAFT_1408591 [Panaeolus papilionaceus]
MSSQSVHADVLLEIPSDQYEARRTPNGIYHTIGDNLCNPLHERAYLGTGGVTISEDYIMVQEPSGRDDGWKHISFFFNDQSKTSFSTILFGKCDTKAAGTRLGLMGNFYPKGDEKVAWDNQVQEIAQLTDIVRENLKANDIKSVLTASSASDYSIRIATRPIYVRGPNDPVPSTVTRTSAKVKLTKEIQQVVESEGLDTLPHAQKRADPDYKGTFFMHQHSKLLQHDIYDINNNLVPPWRTHEVLKPGVLALFEGIFTVWCPPGRRPIRLKLSLIAPMISKCRRCQRKSSNRPSSNPYIKRLSEAKRSTPSDMLK